MVIAGGIAFTDKECRRSLSVAAWRTRNVFRSNWRKS